MACTNGFCSTFQYTTIFYVDWKPTQYIQQYVLKHHCCIQLIEYTFVTKGLFFTHTWKVAANLNSLASEVSPAMATPTWLSIERIFFWWADSSDAALCWGRSNIQVKFNRQQGQVPNWSGTAPSGHHDIIASFLIPTGQTPLKFLVWKPYSSSHLVVQPVFYVPTVAVVAGFHCVHESKLPTKCPNCNSAHSINICMHTSSSPNVITHKCDSGHDLLVSLCATVHYHEHVSANSAPTQI